MKLNDTKCKNAKPNDPPSKSPRKLADGQGLYLWVMPNGAKYWRFSYRFNDKQKTQALGVYPEVSLKEARGLRTEARKLVSEGKDPSLERKKERVLAFDRSENTFETVARTWHKNRLVRWTPKYADEVLRRLENDVFPELGSYPISEITPALVLHTIRKIEERGAKEIAHRQLQKCGEIFRFALAEGKVATDPTYKLSEALEPVRTKNYAALEVDELPDFLKALEKNDARLYRNTRNALKLIMLTFVRTSELIKAEWKEIDFDKQLWTIPAHRMKMRKEHLVPLSDQAIALLKDQQEISGHRPLVFPSLVRPSQPMSNNTILGAIKRLGYKGRMTGHGFRALAMSAIKEKLGYRHEVIDRQLAHAPRSKIDRAYDRAEFMDERTVMMQKWADYIDEIQKC
ncbi:MAG: integrase arm-type DNA-binding domain-containing protein [Pseudomonadota bacterium]|nr:integrase arm-type DNA-binding domain-containing protein [Pseudomonadota bacterium]